MFKLAYYVDFESLSALFAPVFRLFRPFVKLINFKKLFPRLNRVLNIPPLFSGSHVVQDLRRIVFTIKEVLQAIEDYRQLASGFLPAGEIVGATPGEAHALNVTLENMVNGAPQQTTCTLGSLEVLKALIPFCIANGIMMPRAGQKSFAITNDGATLNIKLDVKLSGVKDRPKHVGTGVR